MFGLVSCPVALGLGVQRARGKTAEGQGRMRATNKEKHREKLRETNICILPYLKTEREGGRGERERGGEGG